MAFNGAFSISKLSTLGVISITDTSAGSDANLTGRTIQIYKADNSLLGTFPWAIADASIALAVFDKDYAVNVKVSWTSSSPLSSPSTYDAEKIYYYSDYGWNEFASLTRLQTSRPDVITDKQYEATMFRLFLLLNTAEVAIGPYMADRFAAQRNIDRYQDLIIKKRLYY